MPGGDRCLSGRTGGLEATTQPPRKHSSAPAWAVATSPTLPGTPVSTDWWLAWSPGELSFVSLVKPLREAQRCAVEQECV